MTAVPSPEQANVINELIDARRFTEALEHLVSVAADCDRSSATGDDHWLQVQERLLMVLGADGLQQWGSVLEQFDLVRPEFDAHSQRQDWLEAGGAEGARQRYARVALLPVRAHAELRNFQAGLQAADHAGEILSHVTDNWAADQQKAKLAVERVRLLGGLSREDESRPLMQEALAIVRAEPPQTDVTTLRELIGLIRYLMERIEGCGYNDWYKSLAVEGAACAQKLAALDTGARQELADMVFTLGVARQRLGEADCLTDFESSAQIYRSLAQAGDLDASIHLARIQHAVGALLRENDQKASKAALVESMECYRALWLADISYGPEYIEVLEKFCAQAIGDAVAAPQLADALSTAQKVVNQFSREQSEQCAYSIGSYYLSHARKELASPMPDLSLAKRLLRRARRHLAGSRNMPKESAEKFNEVLALRASLDHQAARAADYEVRRRRWLQRAVLAVGVLMLIGVVFLLLMIREESDRRCLEFAVDVLGEEECVRWDRNDPIERRLE